MLTIITLTAAANRIPILSLSAIYNTRFATTTFWTTHMIPSSNLNTLFYHIFMDNKSKANLYPYAELLKVFFLPIILTK